MIPISLYVSLEVVKVFQCGLLLNQDRAMYHAESNTPFVCRTTTLNEELGQVRARLAACMRLLRCCDASCRPPTPSVCARAVMHACRVPRSHTIRWHTT